MALKLTDLAQLGALPFDDIIDVRSPSEFAEDHVPGAINLPVLNDQERHEIGTLYKQVSPFAARVKGAAMVSRNAARHLETILADRNGAWQPLVYCWRGGQRSGSFATILQQVGWRADLLDGGYKSFRKLVVHALHEAKVAHRLLLIDGNTGTAKTEMLDLLAQRDVQVLDLEGMAQHRGSLFGAMAKPQPNQKMFETRVALALKALDPARPVVLEAESNKIGDIYVPPSLWNAMKVAPRIRLETSLAARADYLVRTYDDIIQDRANLRRILAALVPYHGHDQTAAWQALLDNGQHQALAHALMADHYDPRYARSRAANADPVSTQHLADLQPDALAAMADVLAGSIAKTGEWPSA